MKVIPESTADLRNSMHARIVGKLASESVYVLPAVRGAL